MTINTSPVNREISFDAIELLLHRYNITNLPTTNAILTSVARFEVLSVLDELVHPDTIRFIHRILSAMFDKSSQAREGDRWDGCWLSIPWTYIRKAYHRKTELDIRQLVDLGVLEDNGYISHPIEGRCRGFRVVADTLVDVFNQPITADTPKTFLYHNSQKNNLFVSDISHKASNSIPKGMMNLRAVIDYFDDKSTSIVTGDETNDLNEITYVCNCYLSRINYDDRQGVLIYKQRYHTTDIGGRVYADSGDQHISKKLKKCWFNIPNVYNYDIKGAHVNLFNQLHHTNFANRWIDEKGFRKSVAELVGIPEQIMKRSVLCITYGGTVTANPRSEIYRQFKEHFKDQELANAALARFREVTKQYRAALKNWHQEIEKNTKKYQTNTVGLTTHKTNYKTLASHYLQGEEQAAIQWISSKWNQTRNQYQVISNQFDGLVTVEKIPDCLLEQFRDKFNLTLELKDIG
jgi:hypothetical protein